MVREERVGGRREGGRREEGGVEGGSEGERGGCGEVVTACSEIAREYWWAIT